MAADLLHALDICKGFYSHILANHKASLLINRQQCMLLSQRLLEAQETLQTVHHKLDITGPRSWSTIMDVLLPMQELVYVLLKAQKTVIKDCFGGEKWMELALRQGGDLKETFVKFCMTYNGYVASSASRWDKTARFLNE
jgi:hypothetical protein